MMKEIISITEKEMEKAFLFFENEVRKVRAGKATPNMLDDIMVDYYGTPTPVPQVGSISVLDPKTITIQPWEKSLLQAIEKAIMASNIGITPQNDGNLIRLFLPPLTEERRKEIFKRIQTEAENCRIALRNIRREKIELLKKKDSDGKSLSEDEMKGLEANIQSITNKWSATIDSKLEAKQKEIMTV